METNDIKYICQEIANIYKDKMLHAGYDLQGELMNFTWVTELNGSLFSLYFILPDYWQYAENGRRPGKFPPPDAILKWITFKHLVPRPSANGKVPSTKQLVYLISRKIATKGTEGKHLFQETIDSNEFDSLVESLADLITEQLLEDIEKQIENIYN